MKRRYANSVNKGNNKFIQKRIEEDYFKGYICKVNVDNVISPIIAKTKQGEMTLLGDNYEWHMLYPDGEKYALTIMYNDKKEIVEWYFDIAKELGIYNGIPYEDDLYLDLVIKPDGTYTVLDEEELKNALDKEIISKEDYDDAFLTVNRLIKMYHNDMDKLYELTNKIKSEF